MRNSQALDFSQFKDVDLTAINLSDFTSEQQAVLYAYAQYCQAMIDADTTTMNKLIDPNMVFVHMTGKSQSKDEYLADVASGQLSYSHAVIKAAQITVNGNTANLDMKLGLTANAYGARGTWEFNTRYPYEKRDGKWIQTPRN